MSKVAKPKKTTRYVMAYFGCPPEDHSEKVKVIKSRMYQPLFPEDPPEERLLVELYDGQRVWVSIWRECKD